MTSGWTTDAAPDQHVVEFYLHLVTTLVTLRMLIRNATTHYRRDRRPSTRRLR
ncbi:MULTISPECIES: hypothetical protein [unclassified Streptomyces]|uniref:hypothetical protein n=1 Tax=unclassified Streptomyces TaxID=2593676 RepID=UPI003D93BE5F